MKRALIIFLVLMIATAVIPFVAMVKSKEKEAPKSATDVFQSVLSVKSGVWSCGYSLRSDN